MPGFLAILLCVATPIAVTAQTDAEDALPAIFSGLSGDWDGSGVLLGRPARFRMQWAPVDGGFVRLSFGNAWVGEDGSETPVLSAEAVYYSRGTSVVGVWVDDRPQRLTLEAEVTESMVVTRWTALEEEGRTEYELISGDSVVVRDFVYVDGAERLFGEGRYGRSTPEP